MEIENIIYDEEPVFYCKKCLSLRIRHVTSIENSDYCDDCGSTDIAQIDIGTWEKKYQHRYGYNFLEEY